MSATTNRCRVPYAPYLGPVALAPSGAFVVALKEGRRSVTLTFAELAARLAGVDSSGRSDKSAELAGVLMTSTTFAHSELTGRSYPNFKRLYTRRPTRELMVPGDVLRVSAVKDGEVSFELLVKVAPKEGEERGAT